MDNFHNTKNQIIKDQEIYKLAIEKHQLYFGSFYFYTNYIIAEINEGVFYDWKKANRMLKLALKFYGNDVKPHYISNRKNKYFVNPSDWLNFYKSEHRISSYIIVHRTTSSMFNLKFEKMFIKDKVLHFYHLQDAINWVLSANEEDRNQL